MPLDHYVPQVHLKQFLSPALGNQMYAIRKRDLHAFTPRPRDICRIEDGNTNAYLHENRAIEAFLEHIEPLYDQALVKIAKGPVDFECVFSIAGFVASIHACSPAGMRVFSDPLAAAVEETGRILDTRGIIPPPPIELGGTSLTQLLREGALCVEIDPKYSQAIGIASVISMTLRFGNCRWEILKNRWSDSPFFSSDFPIAIENVRGSHVPNKIVPLSPWVAIRILPNPARRADPDDWSFRGFRCERRNPSRAEVRRINTLLVRCAEDHVFYRDHQPWIPGFVSRHASYRIEAQTRRIPHGRGTLLVATREICEVPGGR